MPPTSRPKKPEVNVYILAAFGVVLVLGVTVLAIIAKGIATGSFYRDSQGKITQPTSRIPSAQDQLLAAFEPPDYQPQPAGLALPQNAEVFSKAMDFYQRKMYLRAIPLLRVTADRQPGFLTPRFYLGICFLLTDRVPLGIKELRKLAAVDGENPYREAAHFYLAKGLLSRNDLPEAREQLQATIALHGSHEQEALELRKKIPPGP